MTLLDRALTGAGLYDASRRLIGASREMELLTARRLSLQPSARLLDFGCGNGRLVPFLPDVEYVGVDNNQSYIASAREVHTSPRVTFECADVRDLESMGFETFDVAVSLGVVHHLADDVAEIALRAVLALLRPGGQLITMDPCFHPEQASLARVLMALDRGRFVRHPADYRRLVERCGGVVSQEIWDDVYRFPYTHCVQVVVRA